MNVADAIFSYLKAWRTSDSNQLSLAELQSLADKHSTCIHVAVMTEPYLSKVRSGQKFIESRLTKVNISPYERAAVGDIILFKRSGGSILAMASIARAEFRQLTRQYGPETLVEKYSDGLSYEPGYIETKEQARFASLLWLNSVRDVSPVALDKRGRQAWVSLQPRAHPGLPTTDTQSAHS